MVIIKKLFFAHSCISALWSMEVVSWESGWEKNVDEPCKCVGDKVHGGALGEAGEMCLADK